MGEPSIVRGEFFSEALGMMTKITAILPSELHQGIPRRGKTYRSLYLLDGAGGSCENPLRDLGLARLSEEKYSDLIIIVPEGNFSFWTDYVLEYQYAHQYYTYATDELIEIVRTLFPVSDKVEDTAIYGVSMGGWGAWLCGLNNPQTYGHVGAQSGMVDMQWAIDVRPFMLTKHRRQFGSDLNISGGRYDLYAVTERLNEEKRKGNQVPRIYQGWGEEDYLLVPNENMSAHLKRLPFLDYTAVKIPGPHGWGIQNEGFWAFMKWLDEGKHQKEEA